MNYRDVEYEIVAYHAEEMDGTVTEYQGVINDRALGQWRVYGATVDDTILECQHRINQVKATRSTFKLFAHMSGYDLSQLNPPFGLERQERDTLRMEMVIDEPGFQSSLDEIARRDTGRTASATAVFTNPVCFVGKLPDSISPDSEVQGGSVADGE